MESEPQELHYITLHIVRHGQTEWNAQDILQGQTDSALTKLGEKQARDLTRQLRNVHFDAFFSSDLPRARQTGEIVALERKLTAKTGQLLSERN